jgi:hypothetical protein
LKQEIKVSEEFTQWTGTARTYHADHLDSDGGHLPIISKPQWTIASRPEDPNVRQALATLEISNDGSSARITTSDQPGQITITVSAPVSPAAFAFKVFIVNVKRHEPITGAPTFTITQSRNSSINH